jgi:hypothetical protein
MAVTTPTEAARQRNTCVSIFTAIWGPCRELIARSGRGHRSLGLRVCLHIATFILYAVGFTWSRTDGSPLFAAAAFFVVVAFSQPFLMSAAVSFGGQRFCNWPP